MDLTVCGNSDPGTSGMVTPFGKMDGLYFDDSMEPDDTMFTLRNAVEKLAATKGVQYVRVNFHEKEDFYKAMNTFRHFSDEKIQVFMSSKENDYSLVVNEDVSM